MLSHFGTSGLAAINGSHKLELGVRGKEETHTTDTYKGPDQRTFSMTFPKIAIF